MTSWKGLSSFWKSSLTPQQLRMPSLNKVEFLSIGISVIALATIGTAIQVLSFLILCKTQFRKFHLTPYFPEHCSGERPCYNSGPASSSDLRIRRKTTDGRYFLSGNIDWSIMAQTCTHRTEKTFNLTNGKQSNFNHGVLATLYPSIFQTAWSLFIQSDAEIRGSGNQGRCCFEKQRLPH